MALSPVYGYLYFDMQTCRPVCYSFKGIPEIRLIVWTKACLISGLSLFAIGKHNLAIVYTCTYNVMLRWDQINTDTVLSFLYECYSIGCFLTSAMVGDFKTKWENTCLILQLLFNKKYHSHLLQGYQRYASFSNGCIPILRKFVCPICLQCSCNRNDLLWMPYFLWQSGNMRYTTYKQWTL